MRIKELCREKGVTVKEVAEKMGVASESLSRAMNGNPTLSTLENIAKALDVEVVELFDRKGTFTALIDNGGELHRFDSIESLKAYLLALESDLNTSKD